MTTARSALRPTLLAILVFAALSAYCSVRSEGFIAADACMHYLAARYAFASPQNFVDVWNRPLAVALYAVPAQIGQRLGVRAVCMLVAIGCALVSFRIAKQQGLPRPALALIFTLGQPMLFLHSFGEMTELPFALLLGLVFLAYQSRRFFLMACLAAWLPLGRPEGFGLIVLVGLALLLHRRPLGLLVLPIPLLLWDVAGWYMVDSRKHWYRWLIDAWPYAGRSMYGHGQLLALVGMLPTVISPLVMPAMIIGVWRSFAAKRGTGGPPVIFEKQSRHLGFCGYLIAILPLFVLASHSILYWLGDMGSFGEARYLLVAAPFWGVLSARGWEWVFDRLRWKHPLGWAALAVLLPPIALNAIHPVVPVQASPDWEIAKSVTDWYRADPSLAIRYPKVMAAHPGVFYYLGIDPHNPVHERAWDLETLHHLGSETILIWDPVFGPRNSSANRAFGLDEIRESGWREVPVPAAHGIEVKHPDPKAGDVGGAWHIFVSP